MKTFWRESGFHLLERDAAGRLAVTDEFLRAYYLRPEVVPVEESCAAERALHAALMAAPRRAVAASELGAIADDDARENYAVLLRFRERLLAADSLEACYVDLFRRPVDTPPLFVGQLAQAVLRNALEGCEDPLKLRTAELLFREQKATVRDGQVLLADLETVEMHASGSRYGSIGRLIVEAQGGLARTELAMLDRDNAARYWESESRHDTVISVVCGTAASEALCRVMETWIRHLLGIPVRITPLRAIDDAHWVWHVGLDAASSAILNDLWRAQEVPEDRLKRLLALFRLDFDDPADMRADLAGRPVYLALGMDEAGVVRMKPQNLIVNLPLAVRS